MKTTFPILLSALALTASAGTKTWTGNAGTSNYGTAGNWDPSGVPAETDDVIIDGVAVEWSGSHRIPHTLTLLNGASLAMGSEIQFGNTTVPNPIITGGTVSGTLVAAQYNNAVLTIRDTAIIDTATGNNGFWQNGNSYLNFEDGETRAASFTYNTSLNGPKTNPFWFFTHNKNAGETTTNPCIRYNNQVVDADMIEENFQFRDNGNGTMTLYFKPFAANAIRAPEASGIAETTGTISAIVSKAETGVLVYALWGVTAGDPADISSWSNSESLGEAQEATPYSKSLTGLTAETNIYFAFALVSDGAVVASTAVASFIPSAYTAVFTGAAGDGLWATAGNWRSGVVPTEADTIRIDADCTRSGNINLQNWNITVNGASFTATGELNPGPRTVSNGSITATTFIAGGAGNALVIRGSSVVATRTTNLGQAPRSFYGADPHFDFRSGAPCSYTYAYNPEGDPPEFETEYNAVFVGGKILVDGAALTAADIGRVAYSTNTTDHTVTLTLLETTVNAAFSSAASARVNGLSATLSAMVEVGGGKPLYVLVGTNATDMTETLVAATAADATTYTFATNGVEGTLYYYQFRLGEANDSEAVVDSATPQTFFASVAGNLFTGTASEHANDARNWSKGSVPSSSDLVYVIADVAKRGTMQWDLENATVAGWVQIGERVNFHTNPSNVLTVAGDVSLSGGANWTHLGPSETPETIVNVAVGGDLTLAADSVIQAGTISDAAARQSRGWTRGCGPGYNRLAGGTHAGDGGHIPEAPVADFVSYGSILDPLSWGSGGWGDGNAYAGGGVVKLVVGGTLTVDGAIAACGFGYPLNTENIGGAGSGGSVNLTAGALEGSGSIAANGGNNGLYGPGSGGRVKVSLTGANSTFADFQGTIEALGGSVQNADQAALHDLSPAAAGTVCLQLPGEDPVVKVHNVWRYGNNEATWRVATNSVAVPSATHLPAKQDADADLTATRWELSGNGTIRLTADARIDALVMAATNGSQRVYTDGHVLKVASFRAGETEYKGTQTAATLPALVFGEGSVVVGNPAVVILLR